MKTKFRLKEIFFPNKDIVEINISEQVTKKVIECFENLDDNNMPLLVKNLFLIPGIASIYLSPYKISIKKGKVFSWEELIPNIKKVIYNYFQVNIKKQSKFSIMN